MTASFHDVAPEDLFHATLMRFGAFAQLTVEFEAVVISRRIAHDRCPPERAPR